MWDEISVTTAKALGRETPGTIRRLPKSGHEVPFGLAGVIVDECHIVCHECATDEELENGAPIRGNHESDYPGDICGDCGRTLDTYLLVYESQDSELAWRIHMTESVGDVRVEDEILSVEEIAECAEQKAYEKGLDDGPNQVPEGAEKPGDPRTDAALWANVVEPSLRRIAGCRDDCGGTYQEMPARIAEAIYNESVLPAYRRGYRDSQRS